MNSLESNNNFEDKDQTKSLKSKARLFTADVEKRTEAEIEISGEFITRQEIYTIRKYI